MFYFFIITKILLLFIAGNSPQDFVKGMEQHHSGNYRNPYVENPKGFSLTELSFLIEILDSINEQNDLKQNYRGFQYIYYEKFKHVLQKHGINKEVTGNIKKITPKLAKLTNIYETRMKNAIDSLKRNMINASPIMEHVNFTQTELNFYIYYNIVVITRTLLKTIFDQEPEYPNDYLYNYYQLIFYNITGKKLNIGKYNKILTDYMNKANELYTKLSGFMIFQLFKAYNLNVLDTFEAIEWEVLNSEDMPKVAFNKAYENKAKIKDYINLIFTEDIDAGASSSHTSKGKH